MKASESCLEVYKELPPSSPEREVREIKSPIDVMYMIHKALRSEATAAEQIVREMDLTDSLQPIRSLFTRWAAALEYHAVMEDQFMTPNMKDSIQVRANELSHRRLEERLEEVFNCIEGEIGRTRLIARTQRHLYGHIVRLQVAQDDHLEEEEDLLLPMVRQEFNTTQQMKIVRKLLVDDLADDKRWIIEWLNNYLTSREMELLESVLIEKTGTQQP